MLYYGINALIGAAVAVLIAFISRTNFYFLSGLAPLFPTFALFAHIMAFKIGGAEQVKAVISFGFLSMIAYLVYLGTFYVLINGGVKFIYSVSTALVFWSISAGFIFYLGKKFIS